MTHPQHLLRGIRDIAETLNVAYPQIEAVDAYMAAPTLRAAGGGSGRSSDVPDPVFAIVDSLTPHDEWCIGLQEAHDALRNLQRIAYARLQEHPDVARQADDMKRRFRCSGDPLCTRWAERMHGKWAGLCATCIRREQRRLEDERTAAAS